MDQRDDTAAFYDALADDYHLVYADWETSVRRQSLALDRIIRSGLGRGPRRRVLDCTCGIGTQSLGLAALGYDVVGTDVSERSIARARKEARTRGLDVRFEVADLRALSVSTDRPFDVVLSADNALPHFIDEADLALAIGRMIAHARPGGLVMASIRDYDALLESRPLATPPVATGPPGARSVTFQLWRWEEDGRTYDLELFVLREQAGAWRTDVHRARYRAIRRAELSGALEEAGLPGVRWMLPDESGFFQPLIAGVRPEIFTTDPDAPAAASPAR